MISWLKRLVFEKYASKYTRRGLLGLGGLLGTFYIGSDYVTPEQVDGLVEWVKEGAAIVPPFVYPTVLAAGVGGSKLLEKWGGNDS